MDVVEPPRLWWIVLSLCIGLLLSSLESTIVATALVSIASDFNDYGRSNWVVIAYLLTYSSFLIIFARLSDITGRKFALLTSLCIFTLASLACGLAQTLTQLVVFRAIQGIGGSGVYALAMVLVSEISPKRHFGGISAMVNAVFVVASAVGPLIGGAIATNTTWRWCFYLNVPGGSLVILTVFILFPKMENAATISFKHSLKRVDWPGLTLCLAASIVVITPLQEGGSQWAWDSAKFIAMIAAGGLFWVVFAGWEYHLSGVIGNSSLLPMVPHGAIMHRVTGACILTSTLTGLAFTSTVIYLPQRFQAVNDSTPVESGIKILTVLLVSAFGATVSGLVLSKRNICSYLIILGTSLQLIGLGLHSSLPTTVSISTASYGYQVILGMGLGTTLSSSFILARIEVERKDIAPVVGTITQLRVLGGVIGVVICRVTQSSYLQQHLSQFLTPAKLSQLTSSLASINSLPHDEAVAVRKIYGQSFNLQFRVLMYIAAANVLAALFTYRRYAKSIQDPSVEGDTREAARQGDNIALEDNATTQPSS